MQAQAIELTTAAQINAIQDIGFLKNFIEPTSPSVVAQKIEEPANLVHYRVKRLVELGILKYYGRKGRQHLYILSAPVFEYNPYTIGSIKEDYTKSLFNQIYERLNGSDALNDQRNVSVSFIDDDTVTRQPPALVTTKEFFLRDERWEELNNRIKELIDEYAKSPDTTGSYHSLVIIHFGGKFRE